MNPDMTSTEMYLHVTVSKIILKEDITSILLSPRDSGEGI